jgi:hypothetical protein
MRSDQSPKGNYVLVDTLKIGDIITWSYHPHYVINEIVEKKQRKGANKRLLLTVLNTETNETQVMEQRADSRTVVVNS